MQITLLGHIEHIFVFFVFFIWKTMFLNSLKIMKKFPITKYNDLFTIDVILYQIKLLLFCDVQTTNLTIVGKIWDA